MGRFSSQECVFNRYAITLMVSTNGGRDFRAAPESRLCPRCVCAPKAGSVVRLEGVSLAVVSSTFPAGSVVRLEGVSLAVVSSTFPAGWADSFPMLRPPSSYRQLPRLCEHVPARSPRGGDFPPPFGRYTCQVSAPPAPSRKGTIGQPRREKGTARVSPENTHSG